MSDEDERQASANSSSLNEGNNRRLNFIKGELHRLKREKTKYNVEKLTQNMDFLQSEIQLLNHDITDMNREILAQTTTRQTLNNQLTILSSSSRVRYTSLQRALEEKQIYEDELQKPNKAASYRQLAQQKINSIVECLPQLQKQEEYKQSLQKAEDAQKTTRIKRDALVETLNAKTRKITETRQLLNDSAARLPDLENEIERFRLEHEQISSTTNRKKQRPRPSLPLLKPTESPEQSLATLEQDTLDFEKRQCHSQLEKIRLLLKYFHEKMAEHNISIISTPCSTPTSELTSPLFHPLTPSEERTILSSFMEDNEHDKSSSVKITTGPIQSSIAVAMKLPRTFSPLDLQSSATNEIIHSPCHPGNSFEFKKELPSDIVDKYAGMLKNKQQQQQQQHNIVRGKKGKRSKKGFGVKHSSQMIALYNDVRSSTNSTDTLPPMPMLEFELVSTIKALQFTEQSVESYWNELSRRYPEHVSPSFDEQHGDTNDTDDIQDSAVDTHSEASSLIEAVHLSKDPVAAAPQLTLIPEARSSSSSDDKKTIVSSSSPPSSRHGRSKADHPVNSIALLTPVEELPPLTMQIAQIERQVSDEGYRSVRNGAQLHHAGGTHSGSSPSLTGPSSYDCNEKVGKWLSSSTPPFTMTAAEPLIDDHFQATDNDDDEVARAAIPVLDD